jgi:hypothetical protein
MQVKLAKGTGREVQGYPNVYFDAEY